MASGLAPMEAAVQETIVDLATTLRWRSYHTYDSRRSAGGYPDLTLVRDRVVFAELKRAGEQPKPDQVEWLDALAGGGAEVYLWRLSDFEEIKRILGRWTWNSHSTHNESGRMLIGATCSWRPGSLWIPGHGRSDA